VGKCLSLYSQDFLLHGPATPLRRRVFDAIKIAMSLVVCFLQRQFHHRWENHGAIFLTKIEPESPRSSASMLSLNTPAVPHQIQAIILKNCSPKSHLSLFQHGHPNQWSWLTMTGKSVQWWTISNAHLLIMTPSESTPQACVQACNPWNCHPVASTGCIIPILLSHSYDSQAYMLLAPWPVCFVDW
jgi:hypothetical protein